MGLSWLCNVLLQLQVMEEAEPAEGQSMFLPSGLETKGRCSSQHNALSKALCLVLHWTPDGSISGQVHPSCGNHCAAVQPTHAQRHGSSADLAYTSWK